jgi:amidase
LPVDNENFNDSKGAVMSALCFSGATAIAARIRSKELSAVEALDYFRARIERFNPSVNAVVVLDWERAYETARARDAALASGVLAGPLHGVPMTIKESFDVGGLPTTRGDPQLANHLAVEDDIVVQRLRAAGAVLFGKTNVPLHLTDLQSYNEVYGLTRNPWNLERGPGGSSGGSAAALAAGLAGVEFGSDIGGSIRGPAHYCGVYGHKPTYNVIGVSRLGPPERSSLPDLCVAGPLARTAEDLAMLLGVTAGPRPVDSHCNVQLRDAPVSLHGLRVALWAQDPCARVQASITERCLMLGNELSRRGAQVSDSARPKFSSEHAGLVYRELLNAETDPTSTLTHRKWLQLHDQRTQLRMQWHEFFQDWDLVICPVAATTAFPHNHGAYRGRKLLVDGMQSPYFQQLFWAGLATCSYLPSTVFPTGGDADRLPLGLQAVSAEGNDRLTIAFAGWMERELGGFCPPPGYAD